MLQFPFDNCIKSNKLCPILTSMEILSILHITLNVYAHYLVEGVERVEWFGSSVIISSYNRPLSVFPEAEHWCRTQLVHPRITINLHLQQLRSECNKVIWIQILNCITMLWLHFLWNFFYGFTNLGTKNYYTTMNYNYTGFQKSVTLFIFK